MGSSGESMFCMLSDKNVFRELLCQHWDFNSLFSPGNRREPLAHAVMFSGAIFHRKARASTDFYMWSSLNVEELQQCLQNLLLTLSSFTKGSSANCPHCVKFGWKENILLVFIGAQNSFWKPACLPRSGRGFIAIDSAPDGAKNQFSKPVWVSFRLWNCCLRPSVADKITFSSNFSSVSVFGPQV